MRIRNRNINPLPARVFSESYKKTGKFDPKSHAILYQILNKNGSSGNQINAVELGALGCIENTHKNYGSSRMEGLGEFAIKNIELEWVIVDINKIKGHEKVSNSQYDRLVNKQFREFDARIKQGKNADSLVYQVDQETQRPLTTTEIHELYDNVFGDGVKKTVYPPHTRQQEIFVERANFRKQNKIKKLIINLESAHTRFGKDKTNAFGLDTEHQIIIDFSGFFATWQIQNELDNNEHWIETRDRSTDDILQDVLYGLQQGKRIWIAISTYIDGNHEKIKMLNIFKNANVVGIVDEPDYQQWRQFEFFNEVLENVIC
jgi:hypothetical protein